MCPHNYYFDVFLQSLNLMLPTCVRKFDKEIVDFVPLYGTLMNYSCQKVFLVLAHFGIQTFSSSTLPISFFFHQGVNLDRCLPEAYCSFLSFSKYDFYIGIEIWIGQKWQN